MDSVKKTFSRWLRLAPLILAGSSAVASGLGLGGSLKVGGFRYGVASAAVQPDLLRYQIGSERQHGPVAILSDLEALAGQFQEPLDESRPDYRMAADRFGAWTDHAQRSALVYEVLAEGDFYFAVLVSQDHVRSLTSGLYSNSVNCNWPSLIVIPGAGGVQVSGCRASAENLRTVVPSSRLIDNSRISIGIQHTATAQLNAQPGRQVNGGLSKLEGVTA